MCVGYNGFFIYGKKINKTTKIDLILINNRLNYM